MKTLYIFLLLTCSFLSAIASANASAIISPYSVETNMKPVSNFTEIKHIIDQTGLTPGFTSGITDFSSYIQTVKHLETGVTEWFGYFGTENYIIFNLGNLYNIDKLAIWNEDSNGIARFVVNAATSYNSTDNSYNWGGPLGDNGSFLAENNPIDQDPQTIGESSYYANVFGFNTTLARYVKLEILSVYENETVAIVEGQPIPIFRNGVASIGEVAFSAAPVPEPTTLLLLGTGLVGLLGMRRIKQ